MRTRALVFGASGQVGTALQRTAPESISVAAHDFAETNVCDASAVALAIDRVEPDVVVNCAAYTKVDDAQTQRDEAFAVNAMAPGQIARACERANVRFIHLSTDYVFDGTASAPYLPDAPVAPINVYGETKLEGERRVLSSGANSVVVRTAWVHSGGGVNFIKTVVRVLSAGTPMRVVDDQIGTPTRAEHLAQSLWRLAGLREVRGIAHFTDAGVASWFDVAMVVREVLDASATLSPARTSEFPRPAPRPRYSVLDKHDLWAVLGYVPPHWRTGVVASTLELLHA